MSYNPPPIGSIWELRDMISVRSSPSEREWSHLLGHHEIIVVTTPPRPCAGIAGQVVGILDSHGRHGWTWCTPFDQDFALRRIG